MNIRDIVHWVLMCALAGLERYHVVQRNSNLPLRGRPGSGLQCERPSRPRLPLQVANQVNRESTPRHWMAGLSCQILQPLESKLLYFCLLKKALLAGRTTSF